MHERKKMKKTGSRPIAVPPTYYKNVFVVHFRVITSNALKMKGRTRRKVRTTGSRPCLFVHPHV